MIKYINTLVPAILESERSVGLIALRLLTNDLHFIHYAIRIAENLLKSADFLGSDIAEEVDGCVWVDVSELAKKFFLAYLLDVLEDRHDFLRLGKVVFAFREK